MCEIRRYTPADKDAWDAFSDASKNGTFLFKRAYMDYHSDRFTDCSFLFYDAKGRLLALLPANIATDNDGSKCLFSHQGLTYGGFILGKKATANDVIALFQTTINSLRENGIRRFHYKQMPSCYHLCPAEEDEYALWRLGATLSVCNISSAVELEKRYFDIPFERRRLRGIRRAGAENYLVGETKEIETFWEIMETNLREKYGVKPVHTVAEMKRLMNSFPNEIKCYTATKNGRTEAGALMYLTRQTAHVQYAHATPIGKADGALDLLYSTLITQFSSRFRYFDIGISNEDNGRKLNSRLIEQKEGFGARGITYKQWTFLI